MSFLIKSIQLRLLIQL